MNGYERIKKVLNGEKADRTPVMLHNFMSATHGMGYTMKGFRSSPEVMAKIFVDTALKFELDGIFTDVDTALEAHAMGAETDFPENDSARVRGPSGRDIDEILSKLDEKNLINDERIQIYLEAIRLIRKQVGGEIFLRCNADQGPFSLAMLLYGMEDFFADMMDDAKKEGILKLINRCYDVHLAMHILVSKAGADATSFGDSSCGPDLISRAMYMEFANPFHRRLMKDLSARDINCICHICGNLDLILPDVSGVGFAGVEVDYKTDIVRAQKFLQGNSVMFGPLDPTDVFLFGSTEFVKAETEKVLEIFKDGGLVIGAGCAVPPMTPEENIRAFVNAVKEW